MKYRSIAEMCNKERISPFAWLNFRKRFPKLEASELLKIVKDDQNNVRVLPPEPREPYVVGHNGTRWYPYEWDNRDKNRSLL